MCSSNNSLSKMSLVAYGSSDESSDDEEIKKNCDAENVNTVQSQVTIEPTNETTKLHLPTPKYTSVDKTNENDINKDVTNAGQSSERIHFDKLPKPKTTDIENMIEDDDDIPPKKEVELKFDKPVKKDRAPVKITVPSLSEFKDVEKETESKSNKMKFSTKGTKLFALLPPPKQSEMKSTTTKLIPCAVNKAAVKANQAKVQPIKTISAKRSDIKKPTKVSIDVTYDSEDEDTAADSDNNTTTDFFSLTTTETISDSNISDSIGINLDLNNSNLKIKKDANENNSRFNQLPNSSNAALTEASMDNSKETLVTNVMNLPREEILLKNQVEVGPKLPVPEQEYNIDTEGNVAFDDKAIEYLCGKRGVKRKNKGIEEVSVTEINWDDIKPDEREWLVKPLTEDPIQKPISVATGGVSSRKKHHITYLAHQAKAIEMELKNQWAQNRLTRKQTQSKYGF